MTEPASGSDEGAGQQESVDTDGGQETAEPTDSPTASDGTAEPKHVCPECGTRTIPERDECRNCGAAVASTAGTSLETWSWIGGLIAGFGIFITPLLAGPPALYCAWKIKDGKPLAARYIIYAVAGTVVFWLFFYPLIYISATA
jgi:ribosomal protein L40E